MTLGGLGGLRRDVADDLARARCGFDHIGQWLVGRSIQVDVAQLRDPGEERPSGCSAAYFW